MRNGSELLDSSNFLGMNNIFGSTLQMTDELFNILKSLIKEGNEQNMTENKNDQPVDSFVNNEKSETEKKVKEDSYEVPESKDEGYKYNKEFFGLTDFYNWLKEKENSHTPNTKLFTYDGFVNEYKDSLYKEDVLNDSDSEKAQPASLKERVHKKMSVANSLYELQKNENEKIRQEQLMKEAKRLEEEEKVLKQGFVFFINNLFNIVSEKINAHAFSFLTNNERDYNAGIGIVINNADIMDRMPCDNIDLKKYFSDKAFYEVKEEYFKPALQSIMKRLDFKSCSYKYIENTGLMIYFYFYEKTY